MKKYFVFAIIMIYSLAFASYDDALVLFQKNKYDESLKMIANELVIVDDFKEGSPNYKLRYLAAHIHWKLGNTRSVVAHFKKCMEIKKDSVNPYIDLSLYLTEKKQYKDAKIIAESGLKVKEDAMLYWVLGKSKMNQGSFFQAKELFEKVNSIDPEIFISNFDLGIVLMKLKKYGEANTAFSAASILNTKSPQVYSNLALSFYLMKTKNKSRSAYNIKSAKENIIKAKKLDPKNTRIAKIYSIINSAK